MRDPKIKKRLLVLIGYLIMATCLMALVTSILAGSVLRSVIAVGCIYLTLSALDYNRQELAGHVDEGVVNEPGTADGSSEGD
jgi:hypothetical protein